MPNDDRNEWSKTSGSRIFIIFLIIVLITAIGVFMQTNGFGMFDTP